MECNVYKMCCTRGLQPAEDSVNLVLEFYWHYPQNQPSHFVNIAFHGQFMIKIQDLGRTLYPMLKSTMCDLAVTGAWNGGLIFFVDQIEVRGDISKKTSLRVWCLSRAELNSDRFAIWLMAPSSPFDLDMNEIRRARPCCVPNLELRDNALKLGGVDIVIIFIIIMEAARKVNK